ncbi:DTW domain-containing protein 1 [Rhizophlyctis rosea]|uniref:tRNA-uridine aminocarboxypropyltransferase 1 n=1 Tax=Rhizophlyctis rosea TaxID=64517 RepID=A0AAD5X7J7_9FUNG|nr:DTW domain-containing protein 1 [Rhizophlyctis rosea]
MADSKEFTKAVSALSVASTDPWKAFKITPPLENMGKPLVICENCKKAFKLYCPRCSSALDHNPPQIKLPIPVDIYRHPGEIEGKTTSVHAKVIAPEDVNILVRNLSKCTEDLASLDEYEDPERILLLFPSSRAVTLSEIPQTSFDRLIVVDGTWSQGRAMVKALSSKPFTHVKIQEHDTLFWRYQDGGNDHLSTIEAIYWFFKDYHSAYEPSIAYDGRYDDLLFYFRHQYDLIQNVYRKSGKPFHRKKLDAASYIKRPVGEHSGTAEEASADSKKE